MEFFENGESYTAIGEDVSLGGVPVFHTTRTVAEMNNSVFCVKAVDIQQLPEIYESLHLEVGKSRTMENNRDILEITKSFRRKNHFRVEFPYMESHTVRYLLAERFPGGMREHCILHFLYYTIQALSAIHQIHRAHGQVSAGHIFPGDDRIKLAFAATVHDLAADQNRDLESKYMPIGLCCYWAAAPEVYGTDETTREADIWMIGVTALELAYGSLKFMTRQHFNAMLQEMRRKGKIPKKIKEVDEGGQKKKKLAFGLNLDKLKKSKFSKNFHRFVLECLDENPERRPTAAALLQHQIFPENKNKFSNILASTFRLNQ